MGKKNRCNPSCGFLEDREQERGSRRGSGVTDSHTGEHRAGREQACNATRKCLERVLD